MDKKIKLDLRMAYPLSENAQSIEWLSLIKRYKDVFILFLDFEVNDQYQISTKKAGWSSSLPWDFC